MKFIFGLIGRSDAIEVIVTLEAQSLAVVKTHMKAQKNPTRLRRF